MRKVQIKSDLSLLLLDQFNIDKFEPKFTFGELMTT